MASYGLFHLTDGPTRINITAEDSATKVDHYFVQDDSTISWSNKVLPWTVSDHYEQLITNTRTMTDRSSIDLCKLSR